MGGYFRPIRGHMSFPHAFSRRYRSGWKTWRNCWRSWVVTSWKLQLDSRLINTNLGATLRGFQHQQRSQQQIKFSFYLLTLAVSRSISYLCLSSTSSPFFLSPLLNSFLLLCNFLQMWKSLFKAPRTLVTLAQVSQLLERS